MDSNQLHWTTLILQSVGTIVFMWGVLKLAYPEPSEEIEAEPETEEQAEKEIRRLERELRRL